VEAEASGAAEDGSSDLLQAAAAKNIEIRSRTRILRIASSLKYLGASPVAQNEMCKRRKNTLREN
jgi:hypothetical protein